MPCHIPCIFFQLKLKCFSFMVFTCGIRIRNKKKCGVILSFCICVPSAAARIFFSICMKLDIQVHLRKLAKAISDILKRATHEEWFIGGGSPVFAL